MARFWRSRKYLEGAIQRAKDYFHSTFIVERVKDALISVFRIERRAEGIQMVAERMSLDDLQSMRSIHHGTALRC